ncbi:hypothetical protein MHYP_G00241780 [Metynnis hypsauchen]
MVNSGENVVGFLSNTKEAAEAPQLCVVAVNFWSSTPDMRPQSPPRPLSSPFHSFFPLFFLPPSLQCCEICAVDPHTHLKMASSAGKEGSPAEGATTQTVTGGSKPLHRFLRAEPKTVGIVMILMGSGLFLFGIPVEMDTLDNSDIYSYFWLGILYFTCGVLYILAERQPTKKIVTASLALSIISILGSIFAAIDFIIVMVVISRSHQYHLYSYYGSENVTQLEAVAEQRYTAAYSLEAVFLFHSLIGGVILIIMTCFARMALRSSRTQTVVVMRNLPSAE